MNEHKMLLNELRERAMCVALTLRSRYAELLVCRPLLAYGIPRGGVPAALAVLSVMAEDGFRMELVDRPEVADVAIDDIVDTGATARRILEEYNLDTHALVDKRCENVPGWIVFPWEATSESSIEDSFMRLFQYIGEDPAREGLQETPARAAKAWRYWCSGYGEKAADVLKTFEDGAANYDEMIVVDKIPVYSHCEHHMAPIFGTATVAYIPNGRIVGLSKINRVVHIFARRLQVQERMTQQIAEALMTNLKPYGCGVTIRARHMCMESRGVCNPSLTTTSAMLGAFREDSKIRAEFLMLGKFNSTGE